MVALARGTEEADTRSAKGGEANRYKMVLRWSRAPYLRDNPLGVELQISPKPEISLEVMLGMG
jgi:hypothetical protein